MCEKNEIHNLIYWKMANGHEHSFATKQKNWRNECDFFAVPAYYFRDGRITKNQGDYFDYILESEHTYEAVIEIYDYNNLDQFVEKGYARYFNDKDDTDGIEFI